MKKTIMFLVFAILVNVCTTQAFGGGRIGTSIYSGYGTQYYDNGYKFYEGNWYNYTQNGYGTMYYSNGSVMYSGYFVNGRLRGMDEIEADVYKAGCRIVDKVFDGGRFVKTEVLRYTDNEAIFSIQFYGDVVTTNYYYLEVVVSKEYGKTTYRFQNKNDNAEGYIRFKQGLNELIARAAAEAIVSIFTDNN